MAGVAVIWRRGLAAVATAACAVAVFVTFSESSDFRFVVVAARALLAGADPYAVPEFLYPIPAAVVAVPFTALSVRVASVVFVALTTGALAYLLTGRGFGHLWALASPPFLLSVLFAQWPPAVMAGALLPALGWLAVVKPNLGVVALAYRPTRAALLGCAVLLLVSLALAPHWPASWYEHVAHRQRVPHLPAVMWPGGFLGLLGLLRWRTPEGRVLAAMTLVPASAVPYDFLLLWLCARTGREAAAMTVAAWFGFFALVLLSPADTTHSPTLAHAVMAFTLLLPPAVIVLRHPTTAAKERAPVPVATDARAIAHR